MDIAVIGASGFVAKNARRYFSKNNLNLVSISRKNFKTFGNESKIVSRNYEDNTILQKIKNCEALVHLVGIGKENIHNNYHQINSEFTKKIVSLCKKSKIRKIIYLSGLGVSKTTTLGYFISKYHAEQHIINSHLDYTIFRPSYIIGKDDLFIKNLKTQIKNGEILIPGSGHYSMQPIHIDDVCKIIYQSLTEKKFKKIVLDLVGPEVLTYENFVKEFSRGKNTPIKKINLEFVYNDAIVNPRSKFSVDDLNLLVGNFRGDHNKLKNISKLKFTSIKKILKAGSLF